MLLFRHGSFYLGLAGLAGALLLVRRQSAQPLRAGAGLAEVLPAEDPVVKKA